MSQHRTEIERQYTGGNGRLPESYRFFVICSCGYVSRWFSSKRQAEDDEAEHVRQADGHAD